MLSSNNMEFQAHLFYVERYIEYIMLDKFVDNTVTKLHVNRCIRFFLTWRTDNLSAIFGIYVILSYSFTKCKVTMW